MKIACDDNSFDTYYSYAKKYYSENGDLLAPKNYKIKEEGKIIKLGKWLFQLRELYEKNLLDENQIKLLKEIGMVFTFEEFKNKFVSSKWLNKYNYLKKYYQEFHNLDIPAGYEVLDEKGNVIKLGAWFNKCIESYELGELNDAQVKLLDDITPNWRPKEINIYKDKDVESYRK